MDLQKSSYLPSTQKRHKILLILITVYMLEILSIIRIIAEIDLLKLCDLEPQGYKVRDSNYFMVDFPKFGHIWDRILENRPNCHISQNQLFYTK